MYQKRFSIIVLLLLTLVISAFTQPLNRSWQLQNPEDLDISQIIGFSDSHRFNLIMTDLVTQEQESFDGSYSLVNDKLTMKFDNAKIPPLTVYISFVNNNLVMYIENSVGTDKWAVFGSIYDTYFKRFMASKGLEDYSIPTPYSTTPAYAPTNTSTNCYTCFGSGRCQVCKGSGYVSGMYGQPGGSCTACSGTGKCWSCKGSGKQ